MASIKSPAAAAAGSVAASAAAVNRRLFASSNRSSNTLRTRSAAASRRRHVSSSSASSSSSSSSASSSSSSSSAPTAALLIHRSPLLTAPLPRFTTTSHTRALALRSALSNPPSQSSEFYFKKGSLAERRFAVAEYTRDEQTFGGKLAGKRPDVGELPLEEKYEVIERQQQEGEEDQDTARVDRHGARDVYLLTRSKTDKDKSGGGGWGLPEGTLKQGEGLHETAMRAARDSLGENLDLWLVTRKPIGIIDEGATSSSSSSSSSSSPTFIFKSHALAGAPKSSEEGDGAVEYAWLTKREIEERLSDGERGKKIWQGVKDLLN